MITVDDRAGSNRLYTLLASRRLPVRLGRLAFGDVSFVGNGPEDGIVPVGIEYKTLNDVLQCITDGRFSGHQLVGMLQTYEVRWLLVEGEFRADHRTGVLQASRYDARRRKFGYYDVHIGGRGFMYKDLVSWVMTHQMRAGLRVWCVPNQAAAVDWLAALYHWWDRPWHEHTSHLQFDGSDAVGQPDTALFHRPGLLQRICKEFAGLGWVKSADAAAYWGAGGGGVAGALSRMSGATAADWAAMPWADCNGTVKRLGKAIGQKIYKELH